MPKLVALLRVKDGILFIDDWLSNMDKLVDEIVVVDNGSTDGTFEKLRQHSKVVEIAQTDGFNEGRDKIMVYDLARKRKADWNLWLDVDEIFEDRLTREVLDKMMSSKKITKYKFRRFHFDSSFKKFEARFDKLLEIAIPSRILWKEQESGFFLDLKIHNGNIQGITGKSKISKYRIKHFGASHKDYLEKKTENYLKVDDNKERQKMYKKHLNQKVPVWNWYEYKEKPRLVNFQHLFFIFLFPFSKVYFKIKKILK